MHKRAGSSGYWIYSLISAGNTIEVFLSSDCSGFFYMLLFIVWMILQLKCSSLVDKSLMLCRVCIYASYLCTTQANLRKYCRNKLELPQRTARFHRYNWNWNFSYQLNLTSLLIWPGALITSRDEAITWSTEAQEAPVWKISCGWTVLRPGS